MSTIVTKTKEENVNILEIAATPLTSMPVTPKTAGRHVFEEEKDE